MPLESVANVLDDDAHRRLDQGCARRLCRHRGGPPRTSSQAILTTIVSNSNETLDPRYRNFVDARGLVKRTRGVIEKVERCMDLSRNFEEIRNLSAKYVFNAAC